MELLPLAVWIPGKNGKFRHVDSLKARKDDFPETFLRVMIYFPRKKNDNKSPLKNDGRAPSCFFQNGLLGTDVLIFQSVHIRKKRKFTVDLSKSTRLAHSAGPSQRLNDYI